MIISCVVIVIGPLLVSLVQVIMLVCIVVDYPHFNLNALLLQNVVLNRTLQF